MKFALTLTMSLMPAMSLAVDLNVAGLQLGAPIVTTPCQKRAAASPVIVTKVTCLTDVVQLGPDLWTGWIVLPYGEKPAIVRSERLKAYSKAGVLVGLDFYTHGLQTQDYDLQALVKKYGEPSSRTKLELQNRLGGKFEGILASWSLDGVAVSYISSIASYDEGLVSVSLPSAAEVRAADNAHLDQVLKRRPL